MTDYPKLSPQDEKNYIDYKFEQGVGQLRVYFIVFGILYGIFGYLDYLLIDEFLGIFLFIRFGIVIPLFIIFIALTYHPIFSRIKQQLLLLVFIIAGSGISFMMILYPNNFSYYGGMFMIIFSGYFLLKLNTRYAIAGGAINFLFFYGGSLLYHQTLPPDLFLMLVFLVGANIIGGVGNHQMEQVNRIKYMQEKKIKKNNWRLQELVSQQHKKLIQIQEAVEASSDALVILDPQGGFIYHNAAFTRLTGFSLEERNSNQDLTVLYKDSEEIEEVISTVMGGKAWKGEREFRTREDRNIYTLMQADGIKDENGEIIGLIIIYKDITDRKRAEEEIRYMGFHDALTGLYNRAFLEEEIKRLDTDRQLPLSIIMADVNGLKLINDTYGHAKGDEMLILTADSLKKACRGEDIIARWGGDEFIILLPQTPQKAVNKVCKRIKEICKNKSINNVPISISLGFACKKNRQKNIADVLREAEDSMYRFKLTESRSARSASLEALLKTLAEKSFETEAHTRRMQEMALKMGRRMGLPDNELNRLNLLIKLHDIGKINISEDILTKGALTSKEWEIIKKHPEIGSRIAQAMPEFAHVAEDILNHHEKWDGSGYPRGLKGSEIPLLARITAIVDAYEVMSNGRPYKKPMGKSSIIAEFKNCSGSQFDPELVNVFLEIYQGEKQNSLA